MCQCPAIQKDPTVIKFGTPGARRDLFTSHGRVTIVGSQLDVAGSPVSWLLSNARGAIFRAEVPAGALLANQKATTFTYSNPSARTTGGITKAVIHITHHGTSYGYKVQAYGDLSAATDANMSLQFYIAAQPTPAIHTESWQRTGYGWKAHGFTGAR